ncbi:MAG: xylulokinase [Paracoccaceae bacterium]
MTHIGIDLGTSGIKAVLMAEDDAVLAEAAVPVAVSIPHLGWSEQDADAWVTGVLACLDGLTRAAPAAMAAVKGIGLSGQMLSALLLGADLRPLRPAILWNDQRALVECAALLEAVPDIGARTNGAPDPGITAPKLLWLARHEPQVMRDARMLMLTKDYVRLALTGEVATEPTDAGGTQLMDVATASWDAQLCAASGWDTAHLPRVGRAWDQAGTLRAELASRWGMGRAVAVAMGCGDNMGSTLGGGATRPGDAVLTVGTSAVACIVDAAFHPGPDKAILTSAHAVPNAYLSMGVVMSATASLDWTARMIGQEVPGLVAAATDFAARGDLRLAPVFLPALSGIRTPLNRPDAMGAMAGLHPGVTPAMLGYAMLEGVAFQIADCIAAQRSVGVNPARFVVVGGGTRSDLWVRLIATALGQPVELIAGAAIAGPAGAVRLARVAAGADVASLHRRAPVERVVAPDAGLAAVLAERKARFAALLPV